MLNLEGKSQTHWAGLLKLSSVPTIQIHGSWDRLWDICPTTGTHHQTRTVQRLFALAHNSALSCSHMWALLLGIGQALWNICLHTWPSQNIS